MPPLMRDMLVDAANKPFTKRRKAERNNSSDPVSLDSDLYCMICASKPCCSTKIAPS